MINMGNRHLEAYEIINPVEFPFQHIIVDPEHPGQYRYVPQLGGMTLAVGSGDLSQVLRGTFLPAAYVKFDIRPSLSSTPPPPVIADEHITEVVRRNAGMVLSLLDNTNIMVVKHGSGWGLKPEEVLRRIIQEHGYKVNQYFPRTGGRKRLLEHVILFGR